MPDHPTALADRLRRSGVESDASPRRRAEYSSDASNYRVVPEVVAFPHDADQVEQALSLARETDVPVTARGAGTSVAGNAVGPGLVLDFSRYMGAVLDIDAASRSVRVQPGCTLGALQLAARPFGLRFGPDPSTWSRCTIGGMVGNNACGPHALAYGRTADNVRSLDVVDGTGRRYRAGTDLGVIPGLSQLVFEHMELIRTHLGQFSRQLSGYSLDHLLPEQGHQVARALVGTEGTAVIVLEADLTLVPMAPAPALLVLGYPDMPSAADDVTTLLTNQRTRPAILAIEGLDAHLVERVRAFRGALPRLPRGAGWLLVEVDGESSDEAVAAAAELAGETGAWDRAILPAGPEAQAVWRIREDGAGLAGRSARGRAAWPGLEDAAVPVQQLGAYLRDFELLLTDHDLQGASYGHFGDGCIHVRLDVPLEHDGVALREFMSDAADLLHAHGGSLSGEHGDGRARSELLSRIYPPAVIELFERFKALTDPDNRLNPGIVVRPAALDVDLRRPAASEVRGLGFAFTEDDGSFTRAVHRCVGVGKCLTTSSLNQAVMCPSYQATRDEKNSTRGRARVLQELTNGSLVPTDWAAPEIAESLDLCLSCKACSRDCPAGVDMAALKSETLFRRYRRRRRPASHYALGWLPLWARLASYAPWAANTVLGNPVLRRGALRLAGVDERRSLPTIATPFHRWSRRYARPLRDAGGDSGRSVVLWVDTFTETMAPGPAQAATRVLSQAGFTVAFAGRNACCGLPLITTGQLTAARHTLRRLVAVLSPYAAAGIPIIGLEPSCVAAVRSDLVDLLPDDPRARTVATGVSTLAEFLRSPAVRESWTPPDLSGLEVIAQPHCHHHAVMGYGPDLEVLAAAGASVTTVAGCCGLAGNFGMERGHYEVSVQVAENGILPALNASAPDAVVLADGFSCRVQVADLGGRSAVHLAELLNGSVQGSSQG